MEQVINTGRLENRQTSFATSEPICCASLMMLAIYQEGIAVERLILMSSLALLGALCFPPLVSSGARFYSS